MRKFLSLTIYSLFFCGITLSLNNLYSQTTWHTLETVSQVQIEYSDPVNCNFSEGTVQAEYIFLKVSNLNNHSINISFRVDVYNVNTGCATCANDEYQYTFNLPANGTIQADCNFTTTGKSQLAIFKKFISKPNKREFERFEITNITVE